MHTFPMQLRWHWTMNNASGSPTAGVLIFPGRTQFSVFPPTGDCSCRSSHRSGPSGGSFIVTASVCIYTDWVWLFRRFEKITSSRVRHLNAGIIRHTPVVCVRAPVQCLRAHTNTGYGHSSVLDTSLKTHTFLSLSLSLHVQGAV